MRNANIAITANTYLRIFMYAHVLCLKRSFIAELTDIWQAVNIIIK